MNFQCPNCRMITFDVPEHYEDKRIKCLKCGTFFMPNKLPDVEPEIPNSVKKITTALENTANTCQEIGVFFNAVSKIIGGLFTLLIIFVLLKILWALL